MSGEEAGVEKLKKTHVEMQAGKFEVSKDCKHKTLTATTKGVYECKCGTKFKMVEDENK